MSNIVIQPGVAIVSKMLRWMGELIFSSCSSIFGRIIGTYGLAISRVTATSWTGGGLVTVGAGVSVNVAAFAGIVKDSDGRVRPLVETATKNVDFSGLSDGSYKLLIQYGTNLYETGTVLFTNGSKTVAGTSTGFTKNIQKNQWIVVFDSAAGNNGRYQVDSVESDTSLTLKTNFTGTTEGGLKFAVGGYFADSLYNPITDAGYCIYEQDGYSFVITQSGVQSYQLYLADVTVTTGVVTLVDKRSTNVLSLFDHKNKTFYNEMNFLALFGASTTVYWAPIAVFAPSGQIRKIKKVKYRSITDASVTFAINVNGANVTGWDSITATTALQEFSGPEIVLNDGDLVKAILISPTSITGITVSIGIENTI